MRHFNQLWSGRSEETTSRNISEAFVVAAAVVQYPSNLVIIKNVFVSYNIYEDIICNYSNNIIIIYNINGYF